MARRKIPTVPTDREDRGPKKKLIDQIPDDEKWKMIDHSGLLKKIEQEQQRFFLASVFYTCLLCVFYVVLESMVHYQFHEEKLWSDMATTCLYNVFPFLLIVVYLTTRYCEVDIVQYGMTLLGTGCGIAMLQYLVFQQSNYGEMLRTPGIATVWIYFVAQLRLPLAIVSLLMTGLYFIYAQYFK